MLLEDGAMQQAALDNISRGVKLGYIEASTKGSVWVDAKRKLIEIQQHALIRKPTTRINWKAARAKLGYIGRPP